MPRRSNDSSITCEFYTYRLFRRSGVYYADGRRSGQEDVGKHSLGTRDYKAAIERLHALDRKLAIDRGLAQPVAESSSADLSITDGWQRYMEYCERPQVLGGVSRSTLKRYRAVRDKHMAFCAKRGLKSWSQIDRQATERYGRWLEKREYSARSQYLELNLIISLVKWLVENDYLPASCRFRLSLSKPEGSDTYCYARDEVATILEFCSRHPDLTWLKNVVVGLATTGMRIGELVSLRWRDIDFAASTIRLTDERSSSRRKKLGTIRTVKGKRGRALPLHPSFRSVLEELPQNPDGIVFHGPRGGRLKPDLVRRTLVNQVIEQLTSRFSTPEGEIGFEHGLVHSFRHFFVSEAFRQGVSEAQIMDWVGHRDSEMVKLYRHLRTDDSHRHMSQLDFGTGDAANGTPESYGKSA